ncbi:hypothetical protein ACFSO9_12435 [Mesonia maritima]|uniref:hypothetical protein n=1 Tax=Mesonia maritima TaxID=1793873 RepID=UPI0036365582
MIGNYNLNDLPLTLPNFETSSLDDDYIKVCINDNPDCCQVIEFTPPSCLEENDCGITDLTATTGDCNGDNTYELTIDFNHQNVTNPSFDLYVRNDESIGYYSLDDLPLTLPNFETSGLDDDYIKVCINDNPDCCQVIEFTPPSCLEENECEITDLTATPGNCIGDNTYELTIDFNHQNATNQSFDLYVRNDESIGYYSLDDLPLTLPNFETSGLDDDYIKVCINDNPDCCQVIEFTPPNCLEENECEITDLTATPGNCNGDNTYELTIDFNHQNAGNSSFDLYVRNDEFVGNYNLNDLPLTLPNFELSGLQEDYIKVCINDNPDCCEVLEFLPPTCP